MALSDAEIKVLYAVQINPVRQILGRSLQGFAGSFVLPLAGCKL